MIRFKACVARLLLSLVFAPLVAGAQTAPVKIDGLIDEWNDGPAYFTDSASDGSSGANFERLWVGSDARFLFIATEFGMEVGLQADNVLALYLDTDLDAATGQSFSGIGAELVWNFGDRSGTFRSGSSTRNVGPGDVGLITAPTVTSDFFEIAFELDVVPTGLAPLFPSDSVRVVLTDGTSGDRLPDAGQILTLPIDRATATQRGPVDLRKESASDIRVLTYNVENDGLFSTGFTNQYTRILAGIAPDIMTFQEIRNYSPQETADRVESLYPAGDGSAWYAAGGGTDIMMVSRYPITETFELQRANPNGFGNRAFSVDPGDAYPSDLMIVAAHLPCCDRDSQRQLEADEIMAFLRDGILDGSIESQTPIIITGDLNLVGNAQQLTTLLSGQIVSPVFTPPFQPDWDGSDFADLVPGTTGTPFSYTWQGQGFSPGRLDFFIFSDAVMSAGNAFALETREMNLAQLQAAGLRRGDSSVSDHLPIVADFRFGTDTAIEDETPTRFQAGLIEALFPNPASNRLTVRLRANVRPPVQIETVDVLGRLVGRQVENHPISSGQDVMLNPDLADGVYVLRVRTEGEQDARLFQLRRR